MVENLVVGVELLDYGKVLAEAVAEQSNAQLVTMAGGLTKNAGGRVGYK